MSAKIGFLMIVSGVGMIAALFLKTIVQPFIEKGHYLHDYFPSTELILGIPLLFGVASSCAFAAYILWEVRKEKVEEKEK